ncbi:MAG: mechanosensitive ion channel [Solobacterium sp.]|jgi:small conductance mechanosensitive channel|nr:mechanosensitive ion channel [Solobacterium sp.]MCH4227735.1 mechanosensitive ion channel [Solobacterium sp.]MCH4283162.1 mechanosensitive ion channel [Solobacterium sp.]
MMNQKRIKHVLIEICMLAAGTFFLFIALNFMNVRSNISTQRTDNQTELQMVSEKLQAAQETYKENADSFDSYVKAQGNVIADYLDHHADGTDYLADLASEWNFTGYELVNASGEVLQSHAYTADQSSKEYQSFLKNGTPFTLDHQRYFVSSLNNGNKLYYAYSYVQEEEQLNTTYSVKDALDALTVGNTSAVTVIDANDGSIIYADDDSLIGSDAETSGYSLSVLTDGYEGKTDINHVSSYVSVQKNGSSLLAVSKPYADLVAKNQLAINLILFAVCIVIALLILYSDFIHQDRMQNIKAEEQVHLFGKLYYHPVLGAKIRTVMTVSIAVIFLLTFYLETLSPLSRQGTLSENRLSSVGEILAHNDETITAVRQEYNSQYTKLAKQMASLLKLDPSMIDHDTLKRIAGIENLRSIYVFDGNGNAVGISDDVRRYSISTDPDDQSYAFQKVVNGSQSVYIQDAGYDDLGEYVQFIGVQRADADGMVQIGLEPSRLEERLKANSLSNSLNSINIGQNGFLFAVDQDSGTVSSYPSASFENKNASVLGISSAALTDGYSGIQNLDGEAYFLNGFLYNTDYVYTAIPLSTIYASRLSASLEVTLVSAIIILVISLFITVSPKQSEKAEAIPDPETKENAAASEPSFFHHQRMSGHQSWTQSASSRYGDNVRWSDKSPEQKLWSLTGGVIALTAILVTLYVEIFRREAMTNNILHYIVNRRWEKGVNLFSLTYCVFVMTDIIVFTGLIRMIILNLFGRFGSRSETVGHLLSSFLKYAMIIGGIFYCLSAFGLDMNTLLASAGILSVVVGLGAQSLIGDILAGISIVFEGSFRVGDIVTIDGWRGEVVEIGIRTTKVRSGGNDIRVFNNSKISSVVNMTKQYSYANVDVGIDYGESLEHVESVLKEELPRIQKRIPAIVSGPFYKGVTELAASSVNIRILAQCSEADRIQVTRDLNREILLVFSKNHINIPFPQVVVNQPAATVAEATKHEKKEAENFVTEQKEQSKDLHKDE